MLILHLSDTHSKHHELNNMPPAEIIIHSGDISFAGSENEVMDFIEWFGGLPLFGIAFRYVEAKRKS